MVVGDSVAARPVDGLATIVSATLPVKPLTPATVIIVLLVEPAVHVVLVGVEDNVKDGGGAGVTVTVTKGACLVVPPPWPWTLIV
jgi:hypothetical protein